MGGLYSLIAPRAPWTALGAGMPFGLAVWAGNYLGLLPTLGLHPPATHESSPRNALTITAHLVWGAALAAVVAWGRATDSPYESHGPGW
jgi:hypothetical protein